jgi:hypothetical protein
LNDGFPAPFRAEWREGVDNGLYQAFAKTVLRGFHKVHSYWVGPEAYREFKAGKRLATIGVKSISEYDLAEGGEAGKQRSLALSRAKT